MKKSKSERLEKRILELEAQVQGLQEQLNRLVMQPYPTPYIIPFPTEPYAPSVYPMGDNPWVHPTWFPPSA